MPALGTQRGLLTLSQPRCVSGVIYKLELHKVGTQFFFGGCIKSAKKGNGNSLSNILSVASLFVQGLCTWIGRQ